MPYKASSPEDYIAQLPIERQAAVSKLRKIILQNLPNGFEEQMTYGMLGYVVPHSIYPSGYHCDPKMPLPFMNLASQKHYIAVYHMGIYSKKELLDWFKEEYSKTVRTKLDMGKSCLRFKKMDTIPYGLIGELCQKITVDQWIDYYEKAIKSNRKNEK